MESATIHHHDDDWELCNDDGFVYKRKKRRLDPSSPPPPPHADAAAAEEAFRRDRRKNTLLNIRDRYRKELSLWENLSTECHSMHHRARELQLRPDTHGGFEDEDDEERNWRRRAEEGSAGDDSGLAALIDRLLIKAEAQEAIIEDVSNLCDVADSLCRAREEEFKQSLLDLPIWGSPRDLMAALSDDST